MIAYSTIPSVAKGVFRVGGINRRERHLEAQISRLRVEMIIRTTQGKKTREMSLKWLERTRATEK